MSDLPVVDLTRFRIHSIRVDARRAVASDDVHVTCSASVLHLETGQPTTIVNHTLVPDLLDADRWRAVFTQIVQQQLMVLVRHELEECLYIDGVRATAEPHPGNSDGRIDTEHPDARKARLANA